MKKFRISMIVLLLAGVLMGGIGTGAAFVEFSDMEYNGIVWLGAEETEETRLVYEMQDKDVEQIYCYTGMIMEEEPEIITNREVPLDEVWFEVEYNPSYGEPVIENHGLYENGEYLREDIHIWLYGNRYDEFDVIMEMKDQILKELKEKKVSSYRFASVTGIRAYVHPGNKDKIHVI